LPLAAKGVIDLRGLKEDTIKLNGEWEFFWGEFCNPDPSLRLKSCQSSTEKYIQFPGQWQKLGYPIDGYATYKLKILLPEGVNDDLALFISDAGSNYAMYINGNLFSQSGKVGKTKEESEVYLKYRNLDIPKEWTEKGEIELIIHVSNFHDVAGGFWDTIRLGTKTEISKTAKQKNALDLIVFGFLFMMGLYHLGLYTIRAKLYESNCWSYL